ncbi:hypothetical protein QVH35_10305 [Candidatus Nitrosotenuis chungbukensis]|uniref:hypothetical protein n=1 Tax=Candidatus Nitrosotenuis chungbukensis TaxID=1353246 RepID=UPI0005B28DF8|nr:hypothetical protein [Candidatus Nitrosotenuis chungbukensis]WKT57699.1 hypothetical protein QVH35_10305 [Candidatus Nitrosotenuis chungbukensis]
MKKFADLKVGEEFQSTCTFSKKELETYLSFSRIKNTIFDDDEYSTIVSGRAIIARMEGEFTRLSQIYGNMILLYGMDGDASWENRNTRFLKPLHIEEILKIKFTISDKKDIDEDFGMITVDFEGKKENGDVVVISKKNLYRIKKEPPR